MTVEPIPTQSIQQFIDENPDYIHVVGMIVPYRPGVRLCMTRVEYEAFIPDTPQNEFFRLHLINWQECLWAMFSVPQTARAFVERIAQECGLRITNGLPAIFNSKGMHEFPVRGNQVFAVENTPNHPIYLNKPKVTTELRLAEDAQLESIFAVHLQKFQRGEIVQPS